MHKDLLTTLTEENALPADDDEGIYVAVAVLKIAGMGTGAGAKAKVKLAELEGARLTITEERQDEHGRTIVITEARLALVNSLELRRPVCKTPGDGLKSGPDLGVKLVDPSI